MNDDDRLSKALAASRYPARGPGATPKGATTQTRTQHPPESRAGPLSLSPTYHPHTTCYTYATYATLNGTAHILDTGRAGGSNQSRRRPVAALQAMLKARHRPRPHPRESVPCLPARCVCMSRLGGPVRLGLMKSHVSSHSDGTHEATLLSGGAVCGRAA